MSRLPRPSVVGHYHINFCRPTEAAQILRQSDRAPRLSSAHGAVAINKAIQRCLASVGPLIASSPSKHAEWAEKVAKTMNRSLALLAPKTTKAKPPHLGDVGDNISRFFAHGLPPYVTKDFLKKHGFDSTVQMLNTTLTGLWLIRGFSAYANQQWLKQYRERENRRTSDLILLAWVREMGDLYSELVEDRPIRWPTGHSPFILFCDAVRTIVIERAAPMVADDAKGGLDDAVLRRFVETLQSESAESNLLAGFIVRNRKHLSWTSARSPSN
jgi:hypothetical protein